MSQRTNVEDKGLKFLFLIILMLQTFVDVNEQNVITFFKLCSILSYPVQVAALKMPYCIQFCIVFSICIFWTSKLQNNKFIKLIRTGEKRNVRI